MLPFLDLLMQESSCMRQTMGISKREEKKRRPNRERWSFSRYYSTKRKNRYENAARCWGVVDDEKGKNSRLARKPL
jgi:hypothetical protein